MTQKKVVRKKFNRVTCFLPKFNKINVLVCNVTRNSETHTRYSR